MKTIVIGGGAAGLVTLKHLLTVHQFTPGLDPIDAQLFEAEDDVGGTFKYRVWDGAEVSALACSDREDYVRLIVFGSLSLRNISRRSPTFASPRMLLTSSPQASTLDICRTMRNISIFSHVFGAKPSSLEFAGTTPLRAATW